ncbi:MAG: hypothetical protein HQL68_01455 [Magnetococcales bacterium]|nr:hypothetical protein [Magnetococcales bacterium]
MLNSIQTNNYLPHLNGVVDSYNKAKFNQQSGNSSEAVENHDGPGFGDDASKEAIENKISDLFSRYPNGGVEQRSHPLGLDLLT